MKLEKRRTVNIWEAALEGNLEDVKSHCYENFPIIHSKKTDMGQNTPLHFAVMGGNIEIVKFLQNNCVEIDSTDGVESTPLMIAASLGFCEIITFLIDHGANVNHQNKSRDTPLHLAIYGKNFDAVFLLIQNGAISKRNNESKSPYEVTLNARALCNNDNPIEINHLDNILNFLISRGMDN